MEENSHNDLNSGGKERRKEQRFGFCLNIYGLNGLLGYTKNISLNGCLLKTKSNFIGKIHDISFGLTTSPKMITSKCEIIWEKNGTFGIKLMIDVENKMIHSKFLNNLAILLV